MSATSTGPILHVDPCARRLTTEDGRIAYLTANELLLLMELTTLRGRVPASDPYRSRVTRLRHKLHVVGVPDPIRSVYGVGYFLTDGVTVKFADRSPAA